MTTISWGISRQLPKSHILPVEDEPSTQLIVTTHSPHIIYESRFDPIRYFRRKYNPQFGNYSDVLNLSKFYETENDTRGFLLQYMKLTHCDLFFADAAILVEGNVERLLLPLMIERVAPQLKSCYLSILELGGAFAHKFKSLIQFLGLTTLVITDLDSVHSKLVSAPKADGNNATNVTDTTEEGGEDDPMGVIGSRICMADSAGSVTANQTLIRWIPKLLNISDLLNAKADLKSPAPTETEPAKVYVAFQTRQLVTWNEEREALAGRTFEEAFAYENLAWCQDTKQKALGLQVVTNKTSPLLAEVVQKIHKRVKGGSFNKTGFALALMMSDPAEWNVPNYIVEGLHWLSDQLTTITTKPVAVAAAAGMKITK
jgi:predicted ATP-dependent endonuclease of OLD family